MIKDTMLTIEEVLQISNRVYRYAIDKLSLRVFEEHEVDESIRYTITSKTMRRYIEEYINRKYKEKYGTLPILDEERNEIIYKSGATKGQRYSADDILEMLIDDVVVNKIMKSMSTKSSAILGKNLEVVCYVPFQVYRLQFDCLIDESDFMERIKDFNNTELDNERENIEQEIDRLNKEIAKQNENLDLIDKVKQLRDSLTVDILNEIEP